MLQLATPSTRQIQLISWGYSIDDPSPARRRGRAAADRRGGHRDRARRPGVQPLDPNAPASLLTLGTSATGYTATAEAPPPRRGCSTRSHAGHQASVLDVRYQFMPDERPIVACPSSCGCGRRSPRPPSTCAAGSSGTSRPSVAALWDELIGRRRRPDRESLASPFSGASLAGVPFLTDIFGPDARILVEMAFGADLAAESRHLVMDRHHRPYVRQADGQQVSSVPMGRGDETSKSQPAGCAFQVDNTDR
jgi:hypothetical protein